VRITTILATVLMAGCFTTGCGGKEAAGTFPGGNPKDAADASAAGRPSEQDGGRPSSQELCDTLCASIARPTCSNGEDIVTCRSGCARLYAQAPPCRETIDAFLTCLVGLRLDCMILTGNGNGPPAACQATYAATQTCVGGASPSAGSGGGAPPSAGSGAPPSARPPPPGCEAIPAKPASLSCGGGGSAGGAPGAGLPVCQEDCTDSQGHSWSAQCSGTICTCSYDGRQLCICSLPPTGCTGVPCCP
jgi:hypothetical protein